MTGRKPLSEEESVRITVRVPKTLHEFLVVDGAGSYSAALRRIVEDEMRRQNGDYVEIPRDEYEALRER